MINGMVIACLFFCNGAHAQKVSINKDITKRSFIYAVKDTNDLALDVYTKQSFSTTGRRPCVIFVFGGAFLGGHRDDSVYFSYFNFLVEHDYIVASISYRLGLRGAKRVSAFHTTPLKNAINMAVEDVVDATRWIIAKADSIGIDTSKIILSGSSAGAITVLETEFMKNNNNSITNKLPVNFKYAGVISFSGAVLSYDGKLKYAQHPAPTLLFHGTKDMIVPYKKIKFFNKGFYGSSWIARTFKNNGYAYSIIREEDLGHEVAILPMYTQLPVILDFLNDLVMRKKDYQEDVLFKDFNRQAMRLLTAKELLKKLRGN